MAQIGLRLRIVMRVIEVHFAERGGGRWTLLPAYRPVTLLEFAAGAFRLSVNECCLRADCDFIIYRKGVKHHERAFPVRFGRVGRTNCPQRTGWRQSRTDRQS